MDFYDFLNKEGDFQKTDISPWSLGMATSSEVLFMTSSRVKVGLFI